jgi:hypothetical protein
VSDAGDDEVHDAGALVVEEWHLRLQVGPATSDRSAHAMRALVDAAVRELAEDLGHRLTARYPGDRGEVVVAT